jgi:hypothetical protein
MGGTEIQIFSVRAEIGAGAPSFTCATESLVVSVGINDEDLLIRIGGVGYLSLERQKFAVPVPIRLRVLPTKCYLAHVLEMLLLCVVRNGPGTWPLKLMRKKNGKCEHHHESQFAIL